MQADLTESVQSSIRPGPMIDSYYFGETNTSKQAYPCVVNTRFVQQFTNLGQGSSQFVISPQQGVSDIVVELVMPSGYTATGLSLNKGWGYGLISRLSVRYGSSAQYFWTGAQLLLQNLMDSENSTKADAVLTLGGNSLSGNAAASAGGILGAQAYLYLKLPHNSCRAQGKPLPFPSDLLVQPIVVTIELLPPVSVVIYQTGGNTALVPSQLTSAQLQVKQEMLTDTSDLLARRVDMNSHAYTFPLPYFCQQETTITLQATASSQSVNLTGFRAGEVRSILCWLTLNSEQTPGTSGGTTGNNFAPNSWYPLSGMTLTYNGEIFSRFDDAAGQLWNLVADEKVSAVNNITYLVNSTAGVPQSSVSYWTELPFAQVNMGYDRETKLFHGKPILNAVVNLTLTTPTSAAYTLHAMYIYNASLLCSRGSSEYIF